MNDPAGCKMMNCDDLINGVCHFDSPVCKFRQDEIDTEDLKDADRFRWLISKGIAWNGCYHGDWKEGEWLYGHLGAREKIDLAIGWERKAKTNP